MLDHDHDEVMMMMIMTTDKIDTEEVGCGELREVRTSCEGVAGTVEQRCFAKKNLVLVRPGRLSPCQLHLHLTAQST